MGFFEIFVFKCNRNPIIFKILANNTERIVPHVQKFVISEFMLRHVEQSKYCRPGFIAAPSCTRSCSGHGISYMVLCMALWLLYFFFVPTDWRNM